MPKIRGAEPVGNNGPGGEAAGDSSRSATVCASRLQATTAAGNYPPKYISLMYDRWCIYVDYYENIR